MGKRNFFACQPAVVAVGLATVVLNKITDVEVFLCFAASSRTQLAAAEFLVLSSWFSGP